MNTSLKFRDLPLNARRYILLHTIGSPLMVGDYVVVIYLLLTGYGLISVGALFTIVNIIEIFFPAIFGSLFDRKISARAAMSFIYGLEGLAYFLFYLVYGPGSWIILAAGVFVIKFATIFYPIFPAYEHYVYPENIREKALIYHLIIPEYVQIIAFPIFGFLLTYLFVGVQYYRYLLLFVSVGSFLMIPYIFYGIEDIRETKIKLEKEKFNFHVPKNFLKLFIIEDLLIIASSLLPVIAITYFVMFVLAQSFFVLMFLEAINSAVTIIGGNYLKDREIGKRSLLLGGVFLFSIVNIFYMLATWKFPLAFLTIAVLLQTIGNLLWFPVHRSMLFKTVPKEKRGAFFGSMSTMFRISSALAPFISALLISLWVYLPFAVAFFLYFLAGLGYYRITKNWA